MIQLKNVTLRRGAKVVLDGVSATLNPGEHVGLVGRNGAGKSSLFALLAGHLHEDGGDFFLPSQWRMAQVAQDMPETCEAATAFVLAGDSQLATLGPPDGPIAFRRADRTNSAGSIRPRSWLIKRSCISRARNSSQGSMTAC